MCHCEFSRAYTAGCCLLSGAVALKSLGETQEERILTKLKNRIEKERERESVKMRERERE